MKVLKVILVTLVTLVTFRQFESLDVKNAALFSAKNESLSCNITISIIQNCVDVYLKIFTDCINAWISSCIFPQLLKSADITPIFKKGDETNKSSFRPINILSAFWKIYKKLLYQQLDNSLQNKFSELLCGFRKPHSTQHVILNLLQYWQENLDKGNTVGTILMDLFKAYDTLHYGILLATLQLVTIVSGSTPGLNSGSNIIQYFYKWSIFSG